MKSQFILNYIIGMLLFLTFIICPSAQAADTIKIGIAGAHSGDLASYGLPTVKAAQLVIKNINAKGALWAGKWNW
jgi:branched-chain amino acid transport system substrate-binding protein